MKTPPGKVKVYRILRNPKRRYAYAQLVKSNITSIEERDRLIKEFRKKFPKDKFFWNYDYRTVKQIQSYKNRCYVNVDKLLKVINDVVNNKQDVNAILDLVKK